MNRFFNFFLVAIVIALVSSCKDTDGEIGLVGSTDFVIGSKVIKNISSGGSNPVSLDFTFNKTQIAQIKSSNGDYDELIQYDLNKITNIVKTVNVAGVTTTTNLTFIYNGNQLSQLQGSEISSAGGSLTVITDFTYDSNGKLSKAFTTKSGVAGSGISKTYEVNIMYSGDNIAKKEVQLLDSANGATASIAKVISYTSYSGKNPFKIFGSYYGAYSNYFENGIDAISPSNYRSMSTEIVGQTSQSQSINYTFNEDETPLTKAEAGLVYLYTYQILN